MKTLKVFSLAVILLALTDRSGFAADPAAVEAVIRKAYQATVAGDVQGVLACCHPELGKLEGTFDGEAGGYSAGRSASLGELSNLALGVQGAADKVTITDLTVEVVKVEGERAIAWARYHIVHEYESQVEATKGQRLTEAWDATDYVVLKKHDGEWRLRRLEERAEHYSQFPKPQLDEWGGVE